MWVKTIGTCCGAIELTDFDWNFNYSADLKTYLEGYWNQTYGTHKKLPQLYIGVTQAKIQQQANEWFKACGFKATKFQGIHPPSPKEKDLILWTFIGDPQTFLGPINWKGKPIKTEGEVNVNG